MARSIYIHQLIHQFCVSESYYQQIKQTNQEKYEYKEVENISCISYQLVFLDHIEPEIKRTQSDKGANPESESDSK